MKFLAGGFLVWMGAGLCGFAADGAGPVRIAKDTAIQLRLRKTVSSASAHPNDIVEFEVVEDVRAGDTAIIPRGSQAWGTVIEASPKARMARSGKLEIDISTACLADGSKVALRADPNQNGSHLHDAYSNEGLFALPALPLLLFVYGKDVSLPEGKLFTVYTAEALSLDGRQFAGKAANRSCGPAPSAGAPASIAVSGLSTVKAESVPSYGDIYVDGKYFGSTPATLRLPAGDHLISVRISGKKSWERVLSLTPGGETVVSAVLEDSALTPAPTPTLVARPEVKEN
jgi:hypothetical protein